MTTAPLTAEDLARLKKVCEADLPTLPHPGQSAVDVMDRRHEMQKQIRTGCLALISQIETLTGDLAQANFNAMAAGNLHVAAKRQIETLTAERDEARLEIERFVGAEREVNKRTYILADQVAAAKARADTLAVENESLRAVLRGFECIAFTPRKDPECFRPTLEMMQRAHTFLHGGSATTENPTDHVTLATKLTNLRAIVMRQVQIDHHCAGTGQRCIQAGCLCEGKIEDMAVGGTEIDSALSEGKGSR